MAIYSIGHLGRREILKMSAVLAGSGALFSTKLAAAEAALLRTVKYSDPSIRSAN